MPVLQVSVSTDFGVQYHPEYKVRCAVVCPAEALHPCLSALSGLPVTACRDNPAASRVANFSVAQIVSNAVAGEEYLLYQCGTAKPAVNVVGGKVFQIPLTRVAVPDTVPYAFLVRPMPPLCWPISGFFRGGTSW